MSPNNTADLRTCPTCGQVRPRKHFVNQRTYTIHKSCRACRNRANTRARNHRMRAKDRHMRPLRSSITKQQQQDAHVAERIFQIQFNRAVYPHKTRVRIMQEKKISQKTIEAIEVRQMLIARYERAYEAQKDMLAQGLIPKNIHDMV